MRLKVVEAWNYYLKRKINLLNFENRILNWWKKLKLWHKSSNCQEWKFNLLKLLWKTLLALSKTQFSIIAFSLIFILFKKKFLQLDLMLNLWMYNSIAFQIWMKVVQNKIEIVSWVIFKIIKIWWFLLYNSLNLFRNHKYYAQRNRCKVCRH